MGTVIHGGGSHVLCTRGIDTNKSLVEKGTTWCLELINPRHEATKR